MLCTFACKTLKCVLSNPVQAALTCDYTLWLINQMAPECFCSLSKPQHVERKDISKRIHMWCTHLCHTYTVMYVLHMKIRIVYSHKYKHSIDGLISTTGLLQYQRITTSPHNLLRMFILNLKMLKMRGKLDFKVAYIQIA